MTGQILLVLTADRQALNTAPEPNQCAEDAQSSKSSSGLLEEGKDKTPDIAELLPKFSGLDDSGKELYPGLEKVVWKWHDGSYKKPPVKKFDATKPSRMWWIEDPELLAPSDPSHLCAVCRHIDFKYLLTSPPQQLLEKVPLSSLEQIAGKKECAFCRLIACTVQVAFKDEELPFEIDGKPIMCELQVLPIEWNSAGPMQLCIYVDALPKDSSIVASQDLLIYSITDERSHCRDVTEDGSILRSRMNLNTIKSWYSTCLDGKCGGNPRANLKVDLPEGFRLIDVRRMCIVEGNASCRYLALSYVWGGSKTLLNTNGIKIELETEGFLLKRSKALPDTIKDAIDLVKELGERYLWVDSLCIIQDDVQDQADQIMAMDSIYHSAVLTIAATSGKNADAGLAGWKTNLRTFSQHVERVQGLSLANRPSTFEKTIDTSRWNTRAWTFQERTLSSRVLYVADQRCFFTCCHRTDAFMESLDEAESGRKRKALPSLLHDYSRNLIPGSRAVNILSYSEAVEAYTSRQLTYSSDILNAFAGVAARFRPLFRSDMLFGMPRSELDAQILWQPYGPMTRRRDPQTGAPIFPSWSWAGWVGKVRCNTKESLSRIAWVGEDGSTFSSQDCRYPKGVNRDPVKRTIYHFQWKEASEKGLPYYWERNNPDQYFLHPTAPEEERYTGPELIQGTDHIKFEAEVTRAFEVGLGHYLTMAIYNHKCTPENHTVCPLPLRDTEGHIAGYVLVPGDISTKLNAQSYYEVIMISRKKTHTQTDRGQGEDNPDLLVDSEATTLDKTYFPDAPDINTSNSGYGFDEQRFDSRKLWCLYNIMLVEVKGGVAYRVGVGTVHIDAWARAKPERKVVILG